MKSKQTGKRTIENLTILLILVVSVLMLAFSFIRIQGLDEVTHALLMMSRTVERIFSIILIITAYNLYKRKRMAWVITIVLLAINLTMHIVVQSHLIIQVLMGCEIAILVILLLCRKDFFKASSADIDCVLPRFSFLNDGMPVCFQKAHRGHRLSLECQE